MLLGATTALGAQKPFLAPKTHFGAQNALLCQKVTFRAKSAFLGLGDLKSVTFLKAKSKVSEQGAQKVDFGSKNRFLLENQLLGPKSEKRAQNAFFCASATLGRHQAQKPYKTNAFLLPQGVTWAPESLFGPKNRFWAQKRNLGLKALFCAKK